MEVLAVTFIVTIDDAIVPHDGAAVCLVAAWETLLQVAKK